MVRHTISLPDSMARFLEDRVAGGHYSDVSDYVCDLIRKDQIERQTTINELRALLDEAEASGVSSRSLTEVIEAARHQARVQGLLDE